MKAMILKKTDSLAQNPRPLELTEVETPVPGQAELLIRVSVCGVCHTELDEIEGRISPIKLPVIPGHQVVGRVEEVGSGVSGFKLGDRVGVGWIYAACGRCRFCRSGRENLCRDFLATGKDVHGGYAEYMTVPEGYAYSIPEFFTDAQAAPLLCAGSIGYRSLQLTGLEDGDPLGLTGFGGSANLVLKMARHKYPRSKVYVFARSGEEREFAKQLGATWAGDTEERAPVALRAIIDTTPAWKPVVEALANLDKGGRLVINAIRKEAGDQEYLKNLSYHRHLWEEREIKSVANITARDIREFLDLAAKARIHADIEEFSLNEANQALLELKEGKIKGTKVLQML